MSLLNKESTCGRFQNIHWLRYLFFLQMLMEVWEKKHLKQLKELESRVASVKPASIDVLIIDAMFFLHLLVDPPSRFGSTARHILGCICSTTSREIHFVFHKTIHPSIKDFEKDAWSLDRSDSYSITSSSQKNPGNWLAALRNGNFKSSLIQYLTSPWDDDSLATTLGEKKLFVNNNNYCYSLALRDERMCKMCEESLYSKHEEAESRMILHLNLVTNPLNVVIRTSDIDVFVIALCRMGSMSSDIKAPFVLSLVNWYYFRKLYFKLKSLLC